jgi:hypothetical protein
MNTTKLIAALSVVLLATLSAQAQGTFQNLDFEQAAPVSANDPEDPNAVTASSALPFWSVYYGNVQQTEIEYNEISGGATSVALVSTSAPFGFSAIDGNYSVLLQGSPESGSASISQTGLIPSGTQSLLFETRFGGGPLNVLVGTQTVPISAVGSGPNYTLYGANISAWAGETEELTFSAPPYSSPNNWIIDDISFSPNPLPEPNIVALTAIGGLLFGARKWFARRS